jgi:uracil-DNA glycosylase
MSAGSFDCMTNVQHHGKSASELATLDVDAIKGVSAADRQHLADAFGIKTIGDLARNRFVRAARAILEQSVDIGHDPGPDAAWSALFRQAPLASYQSHPTSFRLDFGPIYYRGRLDGTARLLIVGQDPAANELVGHRAFIGASGQRLQAFLRRLGIRRDYLMVNTFLYPVFGQFMGELRELSRDPGILGFRNRLLSYITAHNPLEAVIAVGAAARDAVERWPQMAEHQVVNITHPSARDNAALLANWNQGLAQLRAIVQPEAGVAPDHSTYGNDFTDADLEPIPRYDLPFGMPDWHGVGSHATRNHQADGATDNKSINWKAP